MVGPQSLAAVACMLVVERLAETMLVLFVASVLELRGRVVQRAGLYVAMDILFDSSPVQEIVEQVLV
jgi:hypothetical protein